MFFFLVSFPPAQVPERTEGRRRRWARPRRQQEGDPRKVCAAGMAPGHSREEEEEDEEEEGASQKLKRPGPAAGSCTSLGAGGRGAGRRRDEG